MFGNFIRKIGTGGGLIRRNAYRFYNEVPKFDASKDYYKILEVTKDSTDSEVKKSYYRLAKAYHPDSNPGMEGKFKEISEAYSVLSDPKIRKDYNSARSFKGFSQNMGRKAKQGTYQYEEYRSMYENLSPEEQQAIAEQMRKRIRKVLIWGIVMIVVLPFITRKNHRFYVIDGSGDLVPVEFEGGMMGGMMPSPQMMGQMYSNPYPGPQAPQGQYPPQAPMYPPPKAPAYPPPPQQAPYYGQSQPGGYQSPYGQPRSSYPDPYSQVVGGINPSPSPQGGFQGNYRQSNLQPGYGGPASPQ